MNTESRDYDENTGIGLDIHNSKPAPQTEVKHTPGPWSTELGRLGFEITSSDRTIAETADCNDYDEANARLIAASPSMFEALDEAPVKLVDESAESFVERYKGWCCYMRNQALALATGKEDLTRG